MEYIIKIYHDGVVIDFPVIGEERYLAEKEFLNRLAEIRAGNLDRRVTIPDFFYDFYYLDDNKFNAYLDFRKISISGVDGTRAKA